MSQYDPNPAGYQTAPAHDPEAQPTSRMAVTALILGIVSLPLTCVGIGLITGIVALILGIIALGQTGDPPYKMKGKGMAAAGLSMGAACIVLAPVVVLLIGIMLPALGAARRTARQMQNSTQLRGIHMGMVIFAQSNQAGRNAGWYPGLDAQGNPVDLSVEGRFAELLDANAFTPEYIINPADTGKVEYNYSGLFDSSNYSYSMLEISTPGGRRDEWRETINTMAVVLSDRNTNPYGSPESVWSDQGWKGTVSFNDGATRFESSELIFETSYGRHPTNRDDDLFNANGPHDALMIHEGTGP